MKLTLTFEAGSNSKKIGNYSERNDTIDIRIGALRTTAPQTNCRPGRKIGIKELSELAATLENIKITEHVRSRVEQYEDRGNCVPIKISGRPESQATSVRKKQPQSRKPELE